MMKKNTGKLILVTLLCIMLLSVYSTAEAMLQNNTECFINTAHSLKALFKANQLIFFGPAGNVTQGVLVYDTHLFYDTGHKFSPIPFLAGQNTSFNPDGSVNSGTLVYDTQLFDNPNHRHKSTYQGGTYTTFNPDGSVQNGTTIP